MQQQRSRDNGRNALQDIEVCRGDARYGAHLGEQLHAARRLGVRVELQQRAQVLQRVLLQQRALRTLLRGDDVAGSV